MTMNETQVNEANMFGAAPYLQKELYRISKSKDKY